MIKFHSNINFAKLHDVINKFEENNIGNSPLLDGIVHCIPLCVPGKPYFTEKAEGIRCMGICWFGRTRKGRIFRPKRDWMANVLHLQRDFTFRK